MEIIGPIFLSLLAGLSTVIGSLFVFTKTNREEEFIVFCLALSMGVMIIISLFDLLPGSVLFLLSRYGYLKGIFYSMIIFLCGYISILLLKRITNISNDSKLYKIGILSMISLMIHNFPEGIIVFMSAYKNIKIGFKLCIAIMLHNIPEGISISIPIYYAKKSRGKAIKMTLISGFAEPIGAILSYLFLKVYISDTLISCILIYVSGLMICLSLNDILSQLLNYNIKKYMIIGYIISLLSLLLIL